MTTPLAPGSTIGIVGGGQLGRMLAQSARQHGYGVVVLTGGAQETPAGVLADREITGAFDDPVAAAA
ncbi:MAG TPA: 5-(carboxyamino)imidazole ribonucleotide synthase, partial [Acidimicrobiaceae bacterium]|nr:5-(carboxyamino)imidazole ribonucleotide synthase [Acidimicrobiaceae bacterium]